jgi:S1-C subfamily serine protease
MVSKEAAILNEVPEGAYIIDVLADSPAEKSELQKGDIITDFNDTKIKGENTDVLQKMISETKAGASVTITIWRDNKTIKKTLKLETYN